MNRVAVALMRVASDLAALGAQWALIGGLAVSTRCEPRFTRDVDLAIVAPDDASAMRLIRDLVNRGYRIEAIVEQEAVGRRATVRLLPPAESSGGVVVDLLFASSGIEREIVSDAKILDVFAGLRVPVAGVAHLVALKLLSRDDGSRPQDRMDLVNLLEVAGKVTLAAIPPLLAKIEQRGYARGRDLVGALGAFLPDILEHPGEPDARI